MSLLMMGGIETTYREIGYATALECVFRRTTECREDSVESRTSVDLTEKYTDRNLKIQAPRGEFSPPEVTPERLILPGKMAYIHNDVPRLSSRRSSFL
jgi:hypothetical protein